MGSGASTVTSIRNEYNFSGNNNGITSGDQGVYGTTTGASTDVKPTSDMNYSPEINPDFGGTFRYATSGLRTKLLGTISKTPNFIDAARHIGSAAYRVAMGDGDIKTRALDLVESISDVADGKDVLNGKEQLSIDYVKKLSDLQMEVVKKIPEAHDAYGALALGMTGMRNSELNTKPTVLSLSSCFERASEGEKLNAENIVATVGPRMGILPRHQDVSTSTIIQETLDNTVTEHGVVGDLKRDSLELYDLQRSMKCSILHANATQLSNAGLMSTDSWETNDIIGVIKQHTVPAASVTVYPGGWNIPLSQSLATTEPFPIDQMNRPIKSIIPTTVAFQLTNSNHVFRDTFLIVSGRVTIISQPYDPAITIQIGFIYKNSLDVKVFQPVYFINTDIQQESKSSYYSQYGVTDLNLATDLIVRDYKKGTLSDNTVRNITRDHVYTDDARFSFDSSFQIVMNMSKMKDIWSDQIYLPDKHNIGPFKALFCVGLLDTVGPKVEFSLSLGPPSVRIETISNPQYMIYNGDVYLKSVIDLIGTVPEWYTTSDRHDPVYIYKKLVEPLIPYLGSIADLHFSNEGAALNLSIEHVTRAMVKSYVYEPDADKPTPQDILRSIIIRAHDLMYNTGPLGRFAPDERKMLVMHVLEKVVNQSLTHISVWSDRTAPLRDHYARDCREFNAIELEMDKKLTKSQC